jgi:hypothetical protein
MSNRRTEIEHQSREGDRFHVTSQDTDSPVLPVAQLKALSEFRPDLVDWVLNRTDEEARHRRERQKRIDVFIFVERVGGLAGGIVIAVLGLGLSAYLALHGAEATASIVGGGTLASIVYTIVTGRKKAHPPDTTPQENKKKKSN